MWETLLKGIDENILEDKNSNKNGELDDGLKELLDSIDGIFDMLNKESEELKNN